LATQALKNFAAALNKATATSSKTTKVWFVIKHTANNKDDNAHIMLSQLKSIYPT
jgi:hypothetical protein